MYTYFHVGVCRAMIIMIKRKNMDSWTSDTSSVAKACNPLHISECYDCYGGVAVTEIRSQNTARFLEWLLLCFDLKWIQSKANIMTALNASGVEDTSCSRIRIAHRHERYGSCLHCEPMGTLFIMYLLF